MLVWVGEGAYVSMGRGHLLLWVGEGTYVSMGSVGAYVYLVSGQMLGEGSSDDPVTTTCYTLSHPPTPCLATSLYQTCSPAPSSPDSEL